KPFEQPGIAGQCVLVSRRGCRKTKARQIQGYAAKTTAQRLNHITIHERPSHAWMKQQQGRAAPFIDIMDAIALDLYKMALERIELLIEPLRALNRIRGIIKNRNVCGRHYHPFLIVRNMMMNLKKIIGSILEGRMRRPLFPNANESCAGQRRATHASSPHIHPTPPLRYCLTIFFKSTIVSAYRCSAVWAFRAVNCSLCRSRKSATCFMVRVLPVI